MIGPQLPMKQKNLIVRPASGYGHDNWRGIERMDDLSPSDLKTILHSKRANMYYLEHCRVMQKDGRVLYLTEADASDKL